MKPTVLLTGAGGRIGSRLLPKLLDRGFPVRALYHHRNPGAFTGNLELLRGDILDQRQMISAAQDAQIICHLAATFDMFPPARFETDNDALFDTILRGTFNLLEAARRAPNLRLMLYASTDAVYATGPRRFLAPITEETEPTPMPGRFYALAKLVGESLCQNYGKSYGVPWCVIRINWSLGEGELLRIFEYSFWREALSSEDRKRLDGKLGEGKGLLCPVFADGSPAVDQICDPADTAEGFLLAIEQVDRAGGNVFNVGASSPFRYEDFILQVADGLGLPYDRARVKGYEPYAISCEKAGRLLGYHPRHTMDTMIGKALQWRQLQGHVEQGEPT